MCVFAYALVDSFEDHGRQKVPVQGRLPLNSNRRLCQLQPATLRDALVASLKKDTEERNVLGIGCLKSKRHQGLRVCFVELQGIFDSELKRAAGRLWSIKLAPCCGRKLAT